MGKDLDVFISVQLNAEPTLIVHNESEIWDLFLFVIWDLDIWSW